MQLVKTVNMSENTGYSNSGEQKIILAQVCYML